MERELKSIRISEMNLNKEQLDALTEERKHSFMDKMSDRWEYDVELERLKKERIKNIIGFEIHSYRPDFYKADDEFLYWEDVEVVQ